MFGKIGITELLLLLALVVILFGATRLPQLGRGIGEGIRNFKRGLRSGDDEAEKSATKPLKPSD
jgi:sec-independent protein translocase protein TatA